MTFEEWFEQEFPEEMSTPTLKLLYKEIAKKGWDAAMRQQGRAKTCLTCEYFRYRSWKKTIEKRDNMPFRIDDGCRLDCLDDKKNTVTEGLKAQLSATAIVCAYYQEL